MRPSRQKAQAVVELALSMTILLWFALGILDFGRVFHLYIELTNAAREGARHATLLAPSCNEAAIRTMLETREPDLFTPPNSSHITLELCPSTDAPERRTVTITNYPFVPVTPFIADMLGDGSVISLTTSATLPVLSD
jgi:hypothetical protein